MLFRQWEKKYNNSTNECIVLVSYFIQKNSFEFIARSQTGPVLPILDSRGWNKENSKENKERGRRTKCINAFPAYIKHVRKSSY